jgi:predicted enzyme related to lactoylglutathione lyase
MMMKTEGICLIWIAVKDIGKAIKFYTEVAGLELKEYHQEFGWAELAGPAGSILGLAQENAHANAHENAPDPVQPGTNAVVTIAVKDLAKAKEHFINKGATLSGDVIEIAGHVKIQTFIDADGNTMQLVQKLSA